MPDGTDWLCTVPLCGTATAPRALGWPKPPGACLGAASAAAVLLRASPAPSRVLKRLRSPVLNLPLSRAFLPPALKGSCWLVSHSAACGALRIAEQSCFVPSLLLVSYPISTSSDSFNCPARPCSLHVGTALRLFIKNNTWEEPACGREHPWWAPGSLLLIAVRWGFCPSVWRSQDQLAQPCSVLEERGPVCRRDAAVGHEQRGLLVASVGVLACLHVLSGQVLGICSEIIIFGGWGGGGLVLCLSSAQCTWGNVSAPCFWLAVLVVCVKGMWDRLPCRDNKMWSHIVFLFVS